MDKNFKLLEQLHLVLAQELLDKVKSGEAKAGDLNVARQFLKDNGVNELDRSSKLILVNGDNKIIWVVGMRLDKRFSVKKDSVKLLNIEYLK